MMLSTKGRYGLKAMIDLAVGYGQGCLSVSTLAASQGISEAYLERIMSMLRKAELIRASRGAAGGYELCRPPHAITVREVLAALEGTTVISDCVGATSDARCDNACQCSARPLWLKLQRNIDEVLSSTTLQDMADDYAQQLERIGQLNPNTSNNNN